MALKKRDLEEGKVIISSNMTVEDWAYRAVEIYKTRQKEVTKKKYISKMKHCVLEQIGYMPLKFVKPVHCQEVLNLLSGKVPHRLMIFIRLFSSFLRRLNRTN